MDYFLDINQEIVLQEKTFSNKDTESTRNEAIGKDETCHRKKKQRLYKRQYRQKLSDKKKKR